MPGAVSELADESGAAGIHNGHVLGAAAFIAPTLGLYAGLGVAPLLVLTALVAAVVQWRRTGTWPLPRGPLAAILTATIVLGGISFAWSINDSWEAADRLARLALMFFCGLVVVEAARQLDVSERVAFGRFAVAGLVLALAVLAVERFGGAPIRSQWSTPSPTWSSLLDTFSRGMAILALLTWPASAALWQRHRGAAAALWLASLALLLTMQSDAAIVGLIGGGIAVLCVRLWPRLAIRAFGIGLAGIILVLPVATSLVPTVEEVPIGAIPIPSSAHHRLLIWRFTSDRIAERPVLGWGFDSSRVIPSAQKSLAPGAAALPLHPHSLPMQWWLELGLPGAVLGIAVVLSVVFSLARLDRDAVAWSAGALGTATLIGLLSYGAWQNWWLAILFLTAAFCRAALQGEADGK